ncbi:hypothetical protein FAI41_05300 [Acetobacteraceae bacterium]|nr:hypothetical protein FAI41_05300 [Acetobacteraceae bacterium]
MMSKMLKKAFPLWQILSCLGLFPFFTGCASFHAEQKILVDTVPSGADCKIYEEGYTGRHFKTPSLLSIQRQSNVTINCVKEGYQIADYAEEPYENGWFLFSTLASGISFPDGLLFGVPEGTQADASHVSQHLFYRHHGGPWVLDLVPLPKGAEKISLPEKMDMSHPQRLR